MDVLNARTWHGAKYFLICIGLPAIAVAQTEEAFIQCQSLVDVAATPDLSSAPSALPTRDGDKSCGFDGSSRRWTCIIGEINLEGTSETARLEGARMKALFQELDQLLPTCWEGASIENVKQRTVPSSEEARLIRTIIVKPSNSIRMLKVVWSGYLKKVDEKITQSVSLTISVM